MALSHMTMTAHLAHHVHGLGLAEPDFHPVNLVSSFVYVLHDHEDATKQQLLRTAFSCMGSQYLESAWLQSLTCPM